MVVTSFVLLLCVLGISKSVRAHTFEDYVCGFCSSRNGSNSLNMTENDISKFAQPCVTAPPQIVPLDFAIIANNPTFRQIIKSEVERILFNDTMLKNLAKTEVDLELQRRCVAPQCIQTKSPEESKVKGQSSKAVEFNNWTIFQRRANRKVDFFRGWDDYVSGFGDETKSFWLGLEKIYQLTKDGNWEMRVDMLHKNGSYLYAAYRSFKIGPASENYTLSIDGYSGSATDSMKYHNRRPFSTKDRDNDDAHANCASRHNKGGWWYHNCAYSNLNGVFGEDGWEGIAWFDNGRNRWMNLRFTEMRMRKNK